MKKIELSQAQVKAVADWVMGAAAATAPAPVPDEIAMAVSKLLDFYGAYGFDGYGKFVKGMDAVLDMISGRMEELAQMDWEKVSKEGSPSYQKYQILLEISREGTRIAEAMSKIGKPRIAGVVDEVKAAIKAKAASKAESAPVPQTPAPPPQDLEPAEELDNRSVVDRYADQSRRDEDK